MGSGVGPSALFEGALSAGYGFFYGHLRSIAQQSQPGIEPCGAGASFGRPIRYPIARWPGWRGGCYAHMLPTVEATVSDELLEITEKQTMSREAVAERLRGLADQLSRHNQVEFVRNGMRLSAKVPSEVELKVEVEIGEESEIEIELSW